MLNTIQWKYVLSALYMMGSGGYEIFTLTLSSSQDGLERTMLGSPNSKSMSS
jgi:hypothetical protein